MEQPQNISFHEMNSEQKIEYAQNKLRHLSKEDPMYQYYFEIIKNNIKIDFQINKDGTITDLNAIPKSEEIVTTKDISLGLLLRNLLKAQGKRSSKFSDMEYKNFTIEELESIETLKISYVNVKDISILKYCKNLKELQIISINAKQVSNNLDAEYNYRRWKVEINDLTPLNYLKNLEQLTIQNVDTITEINLSNLKNLFSLRLSNNERLRKVQGVEKLKELTELVLYRNNIENPINLSKIIDNGATELYLDFNMYPSIKRISPYIDIKIQKENVLCNWFENISNLSSNKLNTYQINNMNKKANKVLSNIIKKDYTEIEKLCAVYWYITRNVKYDDALLEAYEEYIKTGIAKDPYAKENQIYSEKMQTIYDRKQSSYNALMEGRCVCEGYSNLMHYLLKSLKIKSRTVSCTDDKNTEIVVRNSNHSVIKAMIEGNWYYFDPTWDAEVSTLKNFFKTKEEFESNHKLSITEQGVITPEKKAYTNEELSEIMLKIIDHIEKKSEQELKQNRI